MPLAATSTWMDLEIIIVSEVSQTKKEKYHTLSLIIWKLKKKKKDTNEFTNRKRLTDVEKKLMVTKRERGGEGSIRSLR